MKLLLLSVAVVLFSSEVKAKLKEGDCEGSASSLAFCQYLNVVFGQCVSNFLGSLGGV